MLFSDLRLIPLDLRVFMFGFYSAAGGVVNNSITAPSANEAIPFTEEETRALIALRRVRTAPHCFVC